MNIKEVKILFMGTAEFGIPTLKVLKDNFNLDTIITNYDKPSGRGLKIEFSPVKKFAINNNIKYLQPKNLKEQSLIDKITSINPDIIVVVAFRMIPKSIWQIPKYGTINLHASLLPNYRGSAPINWVIINNENFTGVTTFFIDDKIDTGDISEIKKKIYNIKKISFHRSKKLRTQKISKLASKIAVHNCVRNFVNKLQHNFVKKNNKKQGFVIDGRDIGSVVFKKADLKLYIDVNPEIRAKRRYKQLIDSGEKSIYPQILKEIKLRDKKDKLRKHSPLVIPKDAYIVDNNGSFKDTVNQINILLDKI